MDNILAIVLSSAVLTTIITKIFNDHDRKKDYLIEEAKERRNELRNVSRKLGNVEKYDKDTQYILRDLKLCLNAYGNYSSNGDKNDLLRDAHIWQEMEMLEKECKEQIDTDRQKLCFEKHKEKLLQYIGYLIEYLTEMIKKEATTSYHNVLLIVSLFLPVVFAFWGAWDKKIDIDLRAISYGEFGCDIFYIAISDIYGENMHSHQQSSMYILLGDWIIILCCGFFRCLLPK